MPHTLSLVIPCYNEEKTLEEIVDYVLAIQSEELKLELVIVDDCSRDNSREVAEKLAEKHPEIKLARHSVNQGKGAALRTGFLEATGDFVGIQDADMEYDPKDYLKLVKPLVDGSADVVYGSRYLRTSAPGRVLRFWHSWMNRMLTLASDMFTDISITDMETCYKLFRRDVIREIAPQLVENRFGFEPEVTSLVAKGNYKLLECAISYRPRSYDEGKKIGWKDGVRALYCILHYNVKTAPLPTSLLLSAFAGAVTVFVYSTAFPIFHYPCDVAFVPSLWWAGAAAGAANMLCVWFLYAMHGASNAFRISGQILLLAAMAAANCGIVYGLVKGCDFGKGAAFALSMAVVFCAYVLLSPFSKSCGK